MPSPWDTGVPVVEEQIKPASKPATVPTPSVWNNAKTIKKDKPSWSDARALPLPTSKFQRALEFTLGEGMMTGEFEHMTKLGKTLDLLGRPGYAIKNVIKSVGDQVDEVLEESGMTRDEFQKLSYYDPKRTEITKKVRSKDDFRKITQAAWRGLSGQERVMANQLWESVGIKGVPLLGFATEIALDPLMWNVFSKTSTTVKATGSAAKPIFTAATKIQRYSGYEALMRGAGKTIGGAGKLAQKVPGVSKATGFIADKTGDIGSALHQMFITKSKIPELAAMVDKYTSRRQWLGGEGVNFGVHTRNAIQKVMKDTGKSTDDVQKTIINYIEQPRAFSKVATAGEKRIAKVLNRRLKKVYTEQTDAGVPISTLGAARRARMSKLYDEMDVAVGAKKTQLLAQIDEQKVLINKEIAAFKNEVSPLEIDVAHFSKNVNIDRWKINKKTVKGDLGTDFGTESAALARQQDIAKGGGGRVYHTKISPRRTIDATGVEGQLQYWDKPEEVLEFIHKTGVLGPDEYEKLKNAIPTPHDPKFVKLPKPVKPTSKLIAQPKTESGLLTEIRTQIKRELTPEEMDNLPEILQGVEATIGNLRVSFNPKAARYNIRKVITPPTTVESAGFLLDKFSDAIDDWYVGFRQTLVNKGYDSIKYQALEDAVNPTYKVLTGRIVGPAAKKSVENQQKLLSKIDLKETDVVGLVNKSKAIQELSVSKVHIAATARKLKVGYKEAKEYAKLQKARELGYFPRFTTVEAEAFLKNASKNRGMGAKVWNPRTKNALRRKTSDFTMDEWNTFVKENGIEALGGKKIEEYFMRDPAYAAAIYEMRAAKAITSAEFIQDVGKTFGKTKAPNPNWIELPQNLQKLYPDIKGLKFDPEVVKEVARVTEHYINPSKMSPILQSFDSVQNMWRKWTLAVFPKYHLRNMVGNIWNNYLADVDMINYPRAQAIQLYRKYRGTGKAGEKVAFLELKRMHITPEIADDIIRAAEEHGVLGRGWYGADIDVGIRQRMKQFTKLEKITGEPIVQKGMAVGATIENNARLAHFLDKMDKGMDSMEAALSVKKFLFDYGDLTQFEKEAMRRLFPFYTWTRKNIPLQLEQLYKNPQKFAPLAIPFRLRNEEDLVKLKYARPDLYERLPFELRRTMDDVTYIPLEGLIPAGDLAKLIRPDELIFELLTPYLRAPIELKMNKSMYFDSEIKKYDNETQELWRQDVPVKIKYLLTTILPQARLLSEIDKIVRKKKNKVELTPVEMAFSHSLSSIYKVNLSDLRRRALYSMKEKTNELKAGMKRARRKGNVAETERIRRTYKQVKEEIARIKRQ